MRTSLTVAGLEVEMSVPAGPLETITAGRYAPFLGETTAPVCWLRIEPDDSLRRMAAVHDGDDPLVERQAATVFRVAHPGFHAHFDLEGVGELHCAPDAGALDHGLRILFALLAPRHGGFVLRGTGVIGDDGAHIFAGDAAGGLAAAAEVAGNHPVLIEGYVVIRRLDDAWMAGSTPFSSSFEPPGQPRESKLARLWALRTCPAAEPCPPDSGAAVHALMDNAFVPGREAEGHRAVLDLAAELAATVPSSKLFLPPATIDLTDAVELAVPSP